MQSSGFGLVVVIMITVVLVVALATSPLAVGAARSRSAPAGLGRGWVDYEQVGPRPRSLGVAGFESPTGRRTFADMHAATMQLRIVIAPALAISVWNKALYVIIHWRPQTRPLPALRASAWHTTLMRVYLMSTKMARMIHNALQDPAGAVRAILTGLITPRLLGLTPPPVSNSADFDWQIYGIGGACLVWAEAIRRVIAAVIVDVVGEAIASECIELRDLYMSWD